MVDPTSAVNTAELATAFAIPAVFTNKVYVTVSDECVRLTFSEHHAPVSPETRAAVVMSKQSAAKLQKLLEDALAGPKGGPDGIEALKKA